MTRAICRWCHRPLTLNADGDCGPCAADLQERLSPVRQALGSGLRPQEREIADSDSSLGLERPGYSSAWLGDPCDVGDGFECPCSLCHRARCDAAAAEGY